MTSFFLILLANLIYLPAIWFGVISDDATELKMRPFNVKREKAYNILLHLAVTGLVYAVFGSLPAALLFSVHPVAVQVPCWKGGRAYGMNAALFLLVLLFAPISVPIYFLSNLSIATTMFTPLCFLFTRYWYIALLCPILVWIGYKKLKYNVDCKIKGDENLFVTPLPLDFNLHKFTPAKLIIAVKTFGYYSLACLLPIKNGFYNSFLATMGSSDKENKYWYSLNRHFWGGVLAIGLMGVAWWFNRWNLVGMGIMIFVTSLIPFLNFITVQQFTAPRYAYLSLIGFQVALAGLIVKLPVAPQFAILGALFVFYLDRTIRVMRHYAKDNIQMYELESQVFPDNPRIWYFRYEHMLYKKNPIMAFAEASYGLKHLPEDCQLWFGLACASFELEDYNAAALFLKNSEQFMILADRKNMQELILEFGTRIKLALQDKWKPGNRIIGRG